MTSTIDRAETTTIDGPAGPFTIVARDGVVLASGWTADTGHLVPLIARAIRPRALDHRDELGSITDAVRAYWDGELDSIDDVAVEQRSGSFREQAWKVLRAVEPGEPITYAEYAARCGNPAAVRAAASACASNAAALFVPCHRVVRTGGALGGFRWGLDVKHALLDHEGRLRR